MSGGERTFEQRARQVADQERAIQDHVEAKEQRSFQSDKDDDAPPQTGARDYPVPPLPAQHLEKPGIEAELELQPMWDAPYYRGSSGQPMAS